MKIEVPVYECDVCLRLGYADDHETWFKVGRNGDSQEACSADCLMKMGRQIKAEESGTEHRPVGRPPKATSNGKPRQLNTGGVGGATPNEEPCSVCGHVFDTKQGLGAHMRLGHRMKRNPEGVWAPLPT